MLRCKQEGWELAAMVDTAKRRGLWYRRTPRYDGSKHPQDPIAALEVCGGREGDDYCAHLTVGEVTDREALAELYGALDTIRWTREEAEEELAHQLAGVLNVALTWVRPTTFERGPSGAKLGPAWFGHGAMRHVVISIVQQLNRRTRFRWSVDKAEGGSYHVEFLGSPEPPPSDGTEDG